MQNDEDEDDNTISAGRFPCMPSLVSLQYMRNRLHLAHLGRKLMKWSALATGRELRKIAIALNRIYGSFCEDMSSAFLLLARSRYFCPNMNKMVLENIATNASVTVVSGMKSHAAIKLIQYDLCETGEEPYEHLGLDKGGQQIHETKVAWLQLLKRLVLMMEMRRNFHQVEEAHRSATKKMNVVARVVIPKTLSTIRYILEELDEREREESFRLKKVTHLKLKIRNKEKVELNKAISSSKKNLLDGNALTIIQEVPSKDSLKELITASEERNSSGERLLSKEFIKENTTMPIVEIVLSNDGVNENIELLNENTNELTKNVTNGRGADIEYLFADILMEELCDDCLKLMECTISGKDIKVVSDTIPVESAETSKKLSDKGILISPVRSVETSYNENFKREEVKKSIVDKPPEIKEIKNDSLTDDLELGVFETEYQEIVKVVRSRRQDGTVIEEKMVIKKKIKNKSGKSSAKAPGETSKSLTESSKANSQPGCRAIETRSETLMLVPEIKHPTIRYSLSLQTPSLSTTNNDIYSISLFEKDTAISSHHHEINFQNSSLGFETNCQLISRISSTSSSDSSGT